jgi:hypothetical protein
MDIALEACLSLRKNCAAILNKKELRGMVKN